MSIITDADEQGRLAGAISGVNGLNVVLAPIFALFYSFKPSLPFAVGAAIMGLLLFACYRNGSLRRVDDKMVSA